MTFTQTIGGTKNNQTPTIDAITNRFNSGQGYSYDSGGNLITDADGRQFTFNGDNKQTLVRDAGNQTIGTYFYDGEGKRVKKVTNLETTIFVYSGGKLIAEYSTAAPPQNPTTNYTATDQLGSPRVITNALGQVTSRRDFLPFGEELYPDTVYRKTTDKYGVADSVRQRFTGYPKDTETGLDFAEARMYENRHGRFTAVDPLLASGKSANPQTFNRYVYVLNNPLAYTDPSGLQVGKHIGKVYTDGKNYSSHQFEGWTQFKGAEYVEGADEFTYSVTTDGFYSIGNSAEINARVAGLAFADSQTREQAYFNSSFPSAWIPELQIDPPGYAEASSPRGGRFSIADGETDYSTFMRQTDEPRAFAMTVMMTGSLGGILGGTGNAPRISTSNTSSNSISSNSFGERAFQSKNFGVNSSLFGNSAFNSNRTSGLLNQKGSFFKAGWSGTDAPKTFFGNNELLVNPLSTNNGGMQFRITFGVNPNNFNQGGRHLYIPRTFVPNRVSNPFVYRPTTGGN